VPCGHLLSLGLFLFIVAEPRPERNAAGKAKNALPV